MKKKVSDEVRRRVEIDIIRKSRCQDRPELADSSIVCGEQIMMKIKMQKLKNT